jgi:hypothetical protein
MADRVEARVVEVVKLGDRVAASDFHGHVEVLFEIDALALALHVEQALNLGVFLMLYTLAG